MPVDDIIVSFWYIFSLFQTPLSMDLSVSKARRSKVCNSCLFPPIAAYGANDQIAVTSSQLSTLNKTAHERFITFFKPKRTDLTKIQRNIIPINYCRHRPTGAALITCSISAGAKISRPSSSRTWYGA